MALAKRKVKRFVIDVNCFVTIFINRETDWLLRYVSQNRIELFVDRLLIDELRKVLEYPKIKKVLPLKSEFYLTFVKIISTQVIPKQFHIKSPDHKDDYLYDIALTTNSKLLVTGEKALLNWASSPVETISLSSFKRLFSSRNIE